MQTITKLGSGFSDEDLARLSEELRPHALPEPPPSLACSEQMRPDVWLAPSQVRPPRACAYARVLWVGLGGEREPCYACGEQLLPSRRAGAAERPPPEKRATQPRAGVASCGAGAGKQAPQSHGGQR